MDTDILLSEVSYKATRSSGPGGQHVNKTSTRVELYWNLETSKGLRIEERVRLRKALAKRLNKDGQLVLNASKSRSQLKNKKAVTEKFIELLEKKVIKPKTRKKLKVPKSVKLKRLANKKINSEKKASRRKPDY